MHREDCVLKEPSECYECARSILYSRYCRHHVIARSYIDKLVNCPQIRASDTDGLSKLALEMQKCEITLSKLGVCLRYRQHRKFKTNC